MLIPLKASGAYPWMAVSSLALVSWLMGVPLLGQSRASWTLTLQMTGQPTGKLRLLAHDQGRLLTIDSLDWPLGTQQRQFQYPQAPPAGLYALQWNQQPAIDFVVNGEPQISMRSHAQYFWDSLKILKSPENQAFFAELKLVQSQQKALPALNSPGQQNAPSAAELDNLHRQIQAVNQANLTAARQYAKAHPGTLSAKIRLASQNPIAPAQLPPYLAGGQPNPAYWLYLQRHYWEGFDFRDERLLRSPILYQKLPTYFGQLVPAQVDSMKKAVDQLLTLAPPTGKMGRAILRWLGDYYDNLQVYGGDALLVHLVDRYYQGAQALGIDSLLYLRRKNRADIFRINPTGNIASAIALPDPQGKKQALTAVKAEFTVLYFFSPFCAHCQEVTPQLAALSQQYAAERLQVYAVAGEQPSQWPAWRAYIAREAPHWIAVMAESETSPIFDDYGAFQLPVIYLLDREKRILAKYLTFEQLKAYLTVLLP